ncbi:FISUMP domain-containing protein, partial [Bacteroidota bacterium]
TYTLRWIISNDCDESYDEVTIRFADTATVKGYIYYAGTTIPVSGVTITLEDKSATSGSLGFYEINSISIGNQTILATKDGYDSFNQSINLQTGGMTYNIEMTSASYTYNVFGYIKNEQNIGLSNIKVVMINPDGEYSDLQTTSDALGYFQIPTVPQGSREIRYIPEWPYNSNPIIYYDSLVSNIFISNSDYQFNSILKKYGIPSITTNTPELCGTLVTVGGNITNDGGFNISARGICWSTISNPTINDNIINSDDGIGIFSNIITNLQSLTTYYIKAYATNDAGTTYGNELSFTTSQFNGLFTDTRDGNNYSWTTIGCQVWMTSNLAYLPSVNKISEGSEDDEWGKFYYVYDYDGTDTLAAKSTDNYKTYGVLYNWNAAMNGSLPSDSLDIQGICPDGWHLPKRYEWYELIDYINDEGYSDEATILKAKTGWKENGNGIDLYGFSALPGGSRYSDECNSITGYTSWWNSSSTPFESTGDQISTCYNCSNVGAGYAYKSYGFSIRCIKNK